MNPVYNNEWRYKNERIITMNLYITMIPVYNNVSENQV